MATVSVPDTLWSLIEPLLPTVPVCRPSTRSYFRSSLRISSMRWTECRFARCYGLQVKWLPFETLLEVKHDQVGRSKLLKSGEIRYTFQTARPWKSCDPIGRSG